MIPAAASRPRVLVADGQEISLNGLLRILEKANCEVNEARTTEDLRSKLRHPLPDVLVIDYSSLKDFEPDDVIGIRQQFAALPLMIVTSDRDKKTILRIRRKRYPRISI